MPSFRSSPGQVWLRAPVAAASIADDVGRVVMASAAIGGLLRSHVEHRVDVAAASCGSIRWRLRIATARQADRYDCITLPRMSARSVSLRACGGAGRMPPRAEQSAARFGGEPWSKDDEFMNEETMKWRCWSSVARGVPALSVVCSDLRKGPNGVRGRTGSLGH
jgi:hypothetical protein